MRNRSNSGIRLDYFQRLVNRSILRYQNPATGLIKSRDDMNHSWVRDNVYSILAVWGLALAYRKTADLDEDRAKAYELEKAVVMLMRGLLRSMMMQVDKIEKFKVSQSPKDSLHAKYCTLTGKTVVGDHAWGHLQIDSTSIYLLTLAQMTASGLQIIFTLDEVAFIQNLVFYIETAYRTPDYGIWERGDKTNHGLPELNSSSIGMAKAALEAINELDLFGACGGPASVIHVLPDEAQQCQAILMSMLPRESSSKEVDAGLLTIIGFPAFAVDDPEVIKTTFNTIHEKLNGKYGCCRFLRDGYKTAREDPNRLHYEPSELLQFEKIECQWPLFFTLYIMDGLFRNDKNQVEEYRKRLEEVMLKSEDGIPMMPELYTVPRELVEKEIAAPNSQKRKPGGQLPHMWGQSLYILSRLMYEGFVSPGELDPLNRRLVSEPKPDIVVQVVILAEDEKIANTLMQHGIEVQTIGEVQPIQVHPARVLSRIYSLLGASSTLKMIVELQPTQVQPDHVLSQIYFPLGKNRRLGLSGRPSGEIGLLATSKLYILNERIFSFIPQFMDQHRFYMVLDTNFLIDFLRTEVAYLKRSWKALGRPIISFLVTHSLMDQHHNPPPALVATIKKLQSGYISGTRVHMGKLSEFLTTSCITQLNFLRDADDPNQQDHQMLDFIDKFTAPSCPRPYLLSGRGRHRRTSRGASGMAISGIVRRSRSIQIDPEQLPDLLDSIRKLGSIAENRSSEGGSSCPSSPPPPTGDDDIQAFVHLKTSSITDPDSSGIMSPTASLAVHRHHIESRGEDVDVMELVDNLKQSESLQEQADIIHYLYTVKGQDWDTGLDSKKKCTVRDLMKELYEKAGHGKHWWLVRHTAGMLKKRVEDLAIAATDLLVRQKQLSVGMPPDREHIITCPLPPDELANIIYEACGEDSSTASLTQELLIYLAMFIRTEPKLFHEMLRLRVGLIIQVMASEMARTLKCTGDEASDHLLNLSPYEMKTLLHHILSGKEFIISTSRPKAKDIGAEITGMDRRKSVVSQKDLPLPTHPPTGDEESEEGTGDRQGQWLRRRRLDGALNRVPIGFYQRIYDVLRRCPGLRIGETLLPRSLTSEMTKGEFKFALQVEMVLNTLPQPEYRQLVVEAMMVLTLLVENDGHAIRLDRVIQVDDIVKTANRIFIEDQRIPQEIEETSQGAEEICQHFYDSAPSGRFGTMSYMCRALAHILQLPVSNGTLDCTVC